MPLLTSPLPHIFRPSFLHPPSPFNYSPLPSYSSCRSSKEGREGKVEELSKQGVDSFPPQSWNRNEERSEKNKKKVWEGERTAREGLERKGGRPESTREGWIRKMIRRDREVYILSFPLDFYPLLSLPFLPYPLSYFISPPSSP